MMRKSGRNWKNRQSGSWGWVLMCLSMQMN